MKPLQLELAVVVDRLVLIGGGEFSFGETRAIDQYLIANMPRKSVAFLPTASGSSEYAAHFGKYLKEIDPAIEMTNVPIYRGRDVRREKSLATIRSAGLAYLGGGILRNLVETMRESPAEAALREVPVVAAIGASASAFGVNGFGWIANTVVDAPFDDERLRRLMSLPEVQVGIGIPAKTALAIHADGSTEIIGDGSVAVFRKPPGR